MWIYLMPVKVKSVLIKVSTNKKIGTKTIATNQAYQYSFRLERPC